MCKQSSSTRFLGNRRIPSRVRFQEDHLEERYEVETLSEQDKMAKWMSRADFCAIHADVQRVVQEISMARSTISNSGGDDDDKRHEEEKCFRGLEHIVSSHRKVEIQSFIQDLLEMQEESKYLGVSGEDGFQYFSERNSKRALERALQLANQDATEARGVYAESLALLEQ